MQQTEWRRYWSPGGPAAYPSLIAMRARAAVAAMREPTETMYMTNGIGEDDIESWRLLIDAALTET